MKIYELAKKLLFLKSIILVKRLAFFFFFFLMKIGTEHETPGTGNSQRERWRIDRNRDGKLRSLEHW